MSKNNDLPSVEEVEEAVARLEGALRHFEFHFQILRQQGKALGIDSDWLRSWDSNQKNFVKCVKSDTEDFVNEWKQSIENEENK